MHYISTHPVNKCHIIRRKRVTAERWDIQIVQCACHRLMVPRHWRITFGRRAFAVAGPTVWNSLPVNPGDPAISTDNFTKSLKAWLWYWCIKRIMRCLHDDALYKSTSYLLPFTLINAQLARKVSARSVNTCYQTETLLADWCKSH